MCWHRLATPDGFDSIPVVGLDPQPKSKSTDVASNELLRETWLDLDSPNAGDESGGIGRSAGTSPVGADERNMTLPGRGDSRPDATAERGVRL